MEFETVNIKTFLEFLEPLFFIYDLQSSISNSQFQCAILISYFRPIFSRSPSPSFSSHPLPLNPLFPQFSQPKRKLIRWKMCGCGLFSFFFGEYMIGFFAGRIWDWWVFWGFNILVAGTICGSGFVLGSLGLRKPGVELEILKVDFLRILRTENRKKKING